MQHTDKNKSDGKKKFEEFDFSTTKRIIRDYVEVEDSLISAKIKREKGLRPSRPTKINRRNRTP